MAILFGLLTALAFGASDFSAGLAGRSIGVGLVAFIVQFVAFFLALAALAIAPSSVPTMNAFWWGLAAGLGAAGGPLLLYRGLAVGQMSVVAPSSALVAAVLPAMVGLLLGERLSSWGYGGLLLAVPAIALVSWQPSSPSNSGKSGLLEGLSGGAGLALLFIGLDRAAPGTGVWPLVFGLAFASLIVLPFAWRDRPRGHALFPALWLILAAAIADGLGNILFLEASRVGQLSVVAVLTALFPAVTIILARFILGERWNAAQWAGLIMTVVAVPMIAVRQ